MKHFKSLIQAMPLQEQAFTIKQSNWAKYMDNNSFVSVVLSTIFNGADTIQISRGDLFKMAHNDDMAIFIVATILWGYPRGMRGNHFQTITDEIETLISILLEAKKGISNWLEHYKQVEEIRGLGLSTYSKFLYFLEADIEGNKALILDIRIAKTLKNSIFQELKPLNKVTYTNAVKKYTMYLNHMAELSEEFNVNSGKLEMFIFEFGLNLKVI